MRAALQEAQNAFDKGEVPVGAVIVSNQQIIARGHNQTEQFHDVTAHAEIIAITAAANHFNSKYLKDCTLYVTLEPCVMCAGALAWSQIGRIVYGAADGKRGFMRFGREVLHRRTKVVDGVMEMECREILGRFFRDRR